MCLYLVHGVGEGEGIIEFGECLVEGRSIPAGVYAVSRWDADIDITHSLVGPERVVAVSISSSNGISVSHHNTRHTYTGAGNLSLNVVRTCGVDRVYSFLNVNPCDR